MAAMLGLSFCGGCTPSDNDIQDVGPTIPWVRIMSPDANAPIVASTGLADFDVVVHAVVPFPSAFIALSGNRMNETVLPLQAATTGASGALVFTFPLKGVPGGRHQLDVRILDDSLMPLGGPEASHSQDAYVSGPCESHLDCDDGDSCSYDHCRSHGFCDYVRLLVCEEIEYTQWEFPETVYPEYPCHNGYGPKFCAESYFEFGNLGKCRLAYCDVDSHECRTLDLLDETPCDDGNLCTGFGHCKWGQCQAGTPLLCDDGDISTRDSCDPQSGCVFAFDLTGCACLNDLACKGGDDGNPCTGEMRCSDCVCVTDPATVPSCQGSVGCWFNTCDPETGDCIFSSLPDLSPCDDGNPCTYIDVCANGDCVGEPEACDDDNPCTVDSCESSGLCVHDAEPLNGVPCVLASRSEVGVCNAGTCLIALP